MTSMAIMESIYAIRTYLKRTSNNTTSNTELLDPISTILKLSLLYFYKEGTKISIKNNSIIFHEPSYFQGLRRWSNGSNRNELHSICKPLLRFMESYNDKFKIINLAKKGIKKLQKAYAGDNSIISYSLELYLRILDGKTTLEEKSEAKQNEENELTNNNIFKEMWTGEELNIITSLLEQLEKTVELGKTMPQIKSNALLNKKIYFMKAIQNILCSKDECVRYRLQYITNNM
jgi:hypothetical protein